MARRSCCKVVLKSLQIDGNVRGEVSASRCEERLPLCRLHGGKSLWHDGILKWHRNIRQRGDQRLENERKASGDIVLQPQIRENRRDRSPGVKSRVFGRREIQRNARA